MTLEFQWDEEKNIGNRKKHQIWFEEAQSVFDDPLGRLFIDDSNHEELFILIGSSLCDHILVVVHCYKNDDSVVRIVSARRATKLERIFYEKRL